VLADERDSFADDFVPLLGDEEDGRWIFAGDMKLALFQLRPELKQAFSSSDGGGQVVFAGGADDDFLGQG